jgi:hypothetical protein
MDLRALARHARAVEPQADHAERLQPVLMRGRTRKAHVPAHGFPPLSTRFEPNDLAVDRLKPRKPAERLLHAADRIRRGGRTLEMRRRLADEIGELDASLFARSIPHPRLKTPMRLVDHFYFVAEHDDHHLARIWELLTDAR